MRRTVHLALLAAGLLLPAAGAGQPTPAPPDRGLAPRPEGAAGRIETGTGRVEILGRPVRVGEKLELPEGFIRVEEEGTEDRHVGSFTVVPAETFRATALALADAGRDGATEAEPPAVADRAAEPLPPERLASAACRRERADYLRELWRESGIEVEDPGALIEGLEAGAQGPATGYYWFALASDPFRPLAWSSDLRARADALVRCVHGR